MKPNDQQNNPAQTPKPVAYDTDGRPLYAAPPPPVAPQQPGPQVVYMSRPAEPRQPIIPEDVKVKHQQSLKDYPGLNLSEGEYVISAIKRHPIGLISIWGTTIVLIALICVVLPAIAISGSVLGSLGIDLGLKSGFMGLMVVLALGVLFLLGGYIAAMVYNGNRFYLTNESVIQNIQHTLFSKREQTVSLSNIEDASFRQIGIIQQFLNYGSLRLSTQGDETTYRFNYVSNPHHQVALLNNAVEAFKNGRPVDMNVR